ncbi:MAG: formimidoylglutamate deiminase, partial [Rickettsiales bacterium]
MQNKTPDLSAYDYVLDGMPNLHSHAFQRAMAGMTEYRGQNKNDSFWTWRTLMYAFAAKLTPEHLRDIARWLYIEMLKAGYTHVGEFHYIHHQPDGLPYANPAEMAHAVLEAADDVGIGITLLPVYYATSDFGGTPATEGQLRFLHRPEAYLKLLEDLKPICEKQGAVLGIAPHSLRACTPESLSEILGGLRNLGMKDCPKHIHIAEQRKEVDACMDWSGKRPVEWLLDHTPIDKHWCFVHATHLSESEVEELAKSGAVAGLCPTTEANLGDGVFPAVPFL